MPALGDAATGGLIIWRLPVYPTVHHMLTNPVYAGAYAFGRRTAHVTIENGRSVRLPVAMAAGSVADCVLK